MIMTCSCRFNISIVYELQLLFMSIELLFLNAATEPILRDNEVLRQKSLVPLVLHIVVIIVLYLQIVVWCLSLVKNYDVYIFRAK